MMSEEWAEGGTVTMKPVCRDTLTPGDHIYLEAGLNGVISETQMARLRDAANKVVTEAVYAERERCARIVEKGYCPMSEMIFAPDVPDYGAWAQLIRKGSP